MFSRRLGSIVTFLFCMMQFNSACQSEEVVLRDIINQLNIQDSQSISSDRDKIIAVHDWIVRNIEYDNDYARSSKVWIRPISRIIKNKRAICSEYSKLFGELMTELNMASFVVDGYCKDCESSLGELNGSNHSWNVVYVDSLWYPIDVTWDAGLSRDVDGKWVKKSSKYLLPAPQVFIQDHLPAVPMWQLLDTIVSVAQFKGEGVSNPQFIDYHKEISKYISMNEEHRRLYLELAAYEYNRSEVNQEMLGHQLLDMAGSLIDSLSSNESEYNHNEILSAQSTIIDLCDSAMYLCEMKDWQRAMYAGVIINNAIFRSNAIMKQNHSPEDNWQTIYNDLAIAHPIIADIEKPFFRESTEKRYNEIRSSIAKHLE